MQNQPPYSRKIPDRAETIKLMKVFVIGLIIICLGTIGLIFGRDIYANILLLASGTETTGTITAATKHYSIFSPATRFVIYHVSFSQPATGTNVKTEKSYGSTSLPVGSTQPIVVGNNGTPVIVGTKSDIRFDMIAASLYPLAVIILIIVLGIRVRRARLRRSQMQSSGPASIRK